MRPQVGFFGPTRQYVYYVTILRSGAPTLESYERNKIIETPYSCILENYYKVVYNPIFDKKQA
jgi:hypothetical protein